MNDLIEVVKFAALMATGFIVFFATLGGFVLAVMLVAHLLTGAPL